MRGKEKEITKERKMPVRLLVVLVLAVLLALHERDRTLLDLLHTRIVSEVLLERQPLLEDRLALLCSWRIRSVSEGRRREGRKEAYCLIAVG